MFFSSKRKYKNYYLNFRLTKGRIKARQKKMAQIAKLLDIPTNTPHCTTPPNYALIGLRSERKNTMI